MYSVNREIREMQIEQELAEILPVRKSRSAIYGKIHSRGRDAVTLRAESIACLVTRMRLP